MANTRVKKVYRLSVASRNHCGNRLDERDDWLSLIISVPEARCNKEICKLFPYRIARLERGQM